MIKVFKKNNGLTLILFVVIIVLQLTVILHYGQTKSGFFGDEIYSYGLANSHYVPFLDPSSVKEYGNHSGWVKSDYYTNYVEVTDNARFSYGSVYFNQAADVHPPFYYNLLHTVCSFFPNSFSKWYGIGLNIPIFILCNIVLFCISRNLIKDDKLALLPCVLWGFSAAGISNILYIRMYLLLTLIMLLLTLFHLKLIEVEKLKLKDVLPILLTVMIGGVTHYYSYIFAFFVAAGYSLYFFLNKKFYNFFIYCITMLSGVILAVMLFPAVIDQVFSGYRGTETRSNLLNSNMEQIKGFGKIINQSFFGDLLFPILLLSLLILVLFSILQLIRYIKSDNKLVEKGLISNVLNIFKTHCLEKIEMKLWINGLIIFIALIMFTAISIKISPFIMNRYLYPIYPFIAIYVTLMLVTITKMLIKNKNILFYTNVLIMLVIAGLSVFKSKIDFQYPETPHYLELAQQDSDRDCIFIYNKSQWYDTYNNLFCLAKYDEVFYLCKEDIDSLPEVLQKRDTQENKLLIYLPESMDQSEKDTILSKITEYSQNKSYSYIYNYYASIYSID